MSASTNGALARLSSVVGAAVLLTVLSACSGGGPESTEAADGALPVPANAVPDDIVAATDPPRPAETDVVISNAEWDETAAAVQVGGYVSPVVEDGGTCTLELAQGQRAVEVEGEATADATTTICGGLSVDGHRLSAGSWTAVLRYDSPTTSGVSEAITVEVPS